MSMSDSSEDEDLSRFKEAVDTTFVKLIDESRGKTVQRLKTHQPSERYLEVSSHYNDVKVPKEMQKLIGAKISAIINNLVEYVDIEQIYKYNEEHKTKGGVKLFKDSEGFLSCKEVKDTFTESHNRISKKSKWKRRKKLIDQDAEINENDKIKAAVVTGDYVLSKKDTQHWVSRRKEKLFTYRAGGRNKNILLEV